jgi:hypothetical protein
MNLIACRLLNGVFCLEFHNFSKQERDAANP